MMSSRSKVERSGNDDLQTWARNERGGGVLLCKICNAILVRSSVPGWGESESRTEWSEKDAVARASVLDISARLVNRWSCETSAISSFKNTMPRARRRSKYIPTPWNSSQVRAGRTKRGNGGGLRLSGPIVNREGVNRRMSVLSLVIAETLEAMSSGEMYPESGMLRRER